MIIKTWKWINAMGSPEEDCWFVHTKYQYSSFEDSSPFNFHHLHLKIHHHSIFIIFIWRFIILHHLHLKIHHHVDDWWCWDDWWRLYWDDRCTNVMTGNCRLLLWWMADDWALVQSTRFIQFIVPSDGDSSYIKKLDQNCWFWWLAYIGAFTSCNCTDLFGFVHNEQVHNEQNRFTTNKIGSQRTKSHFSTIFKNCGVSDFFHFSCLPTG